MQEYLDSLLRGICDKLQLTKSLYDKANERYQTIAKILDKNDALNGIELNIYPQGSFKLNHRYQVQLPHFPQKPASGAFRLRFWDSGYRVKLPKNPHTYK